MVKRGDGTIGGSQSEKKSNKGLKPKEKKRVGRRRVRLEKGSRQSISFV